MPYATVAHQEIVLQVHEDAHEAIDSWGLAQF